MLSHLSKSFRIFNLKALSRSMYTGHVKNRPDSEDQSKWINDVAKKNIEKEVRKEMKKEAEYDNENKKFMLFTEVEKEFKLMKEMEKAAKKFEMEGLKVTVEQDVWVKEKREKTK